MPEFKKDVARGVHILLPIIMLALFSFACAQRSPSEERAIRINDYSLSSGGFDELFKELIVPEDTPKARELFLENLITRKLLLQEAQREGLDKEKDFLKSVENFWEQALLKIVIDKKMKEEMSSGITVTDQEIQDGYERWVQANPGNPKTLDELRETIKVQCLRAKQAAAFNAWIEALRKDAKIRVDRKALGIE